MCMAVQLKGVNFTYDFKLILEDIHLEIKERDFLAIIGPNGGGKTTLLRLILGSLRPDKGEIHVLGLPVNKARHFMGYVPQHEVFDKDFPVSAMEMVLMGRLNAKSFFPFYSRDDYAAAKETMGVLGVEDLADYHYGELSGGQKQRVLIARALAGRPKLLVLDEPTSSVDSRVEQDIYELLAKLNKEITIIIVSHDLGFVSSYVNKVACLNKRLAIHNIEEISRDIISELYKSPIEIIEHQCFL
ncbi:MAG: ABC transporter ATP-binding protein [Firmicutes bacterium]|jgi:zinc transport system ATP-binding protein|nr:ABC transporter ATP-binding protein [Bacillota bacterium]